jgi:hypothetical protein
MESEFFSSINGLFPEGPVNYDFLIIDFFTIHLLDSCIGLFLGVVLNEGIPLGISGFPVHIEVNALDLSVLAKDIIDIIFLTFFMQSGNNDDPSFDCWVRERVHL